MNPAFDDPRRRRWRLGVEYLATRIRGGGVSGSRPRPEPAADGLTATSFDHYREQLLRKLQDEAAPLLVGASQVVCWRYRWRSRFRRALVLVNPVPPSPLHERLPPREPYPAIIPGDVKPVSLPPAAPCPMPITRRGCVRVPPVA